MYFRGEGVRQNITVGYIRERGSRSAIFWCMNNVNVRIYKGFGFSIS